MSHSSRGRVICGLLARREVSLLVSDNHPQIHDQKSAGTSSFVGAIDTKGDYYIIALVKHG